MKSQIYTLETKFNFGKHFGKSLKEVIESGERRYIGYIIFHNILWFILDPDTMDFLEKNGFFNNLEMSFPCDTGSFPMNGIVGFRKEDILSMLKKNFNEYIYDPVAYEIKANEQFQKFLNKKESVDL